MNYYELLRVDRNASTDEITRAYRKAALKIHPDRHQDNADRATEAFKRLQHVYDTLVDPESRAEYDGLIAEPAKKPEPEPKRKTEPERYPFRTIVKDGLIVGLILGLIGGLITLFTL